jgi:CheY-like chemotaxis protein
MTRPYRAVLIEDDADLRRLVQVSLKFTAGWDVAGAANGASGIELVQQSLPDVVLVDLMMPGMDGYEVCRLLKDHPATRAIPRILFTARKNLDDAKLAEAGLAGVIAKPFDLDTLAGQIQILCAEDQHD